MSFGGVPVDFQFSPDGKNAAVRVEGRYSMNEMKHLSKLPPEKSEATLGQDLGSWIGAHVRMLEAYQGCAAIWVPDNLRSAVTRPHRYEPTINRRYDDLAHHREARVHDDQAGALADGFGELLHLRVVHVLAELRSDEHEAARAPDVGALGRPHFLAEGQVEADIARAAALRERRGRNVRLWPRWPQSWRRKSAENDGGRGSPWGLSVQRTCAKGTSGDRKARDESGTNAGTRTRGRAADHDCLVGFTIYELVTPQRR